MHNMLQMMEEKKLYNVNLDARINLLCDRLQIIYIRLMILILYRFAVINLLRITLKKEGKI